jgi:hypothetical protein
MIFRDPVDGADFAQHFQAGLVGAAMRRAPKAGDAGRDAGKRVRARRPGQTHRRGRGVLFVIGMQHQDPVHRFSRIGLTTYSSAGTEKHMCRKLPA